MTTIDPVHDPRDKVEITLHRTHENKLCSNRYTFVNIADAKQFMDGASDAEPEVGSYEAYFAGLEVPRSPRAQAAVECQSKEAFRTSKLPAKADAA